MDSVVQYLHLAPGLPWVLMILGATIDDPTVPTLRNAPVARKLKVRVLPRSADIATAAACCMPQGAIRHRPALLRESCLLVAFERASGLPIKQQRPIRRLLRITQRIVL